MIQVYNDFLKTSECLKIEDLVRQPVWKYFHQVNDKVSDNLFWSISVEHLELFNDTIFNRIKSSVGDSSLTFSRIYFAGHTACSSSNLHQDNTDDNAMSFVIYCNQTWSPEFGGNIVFMTNDGPISHYPKPYSAVYFNSNIFHGVQPLSKDFNGMRISLVYKLHKNDN